MAPKKKKSKLVDQGRYNNDIENQTTYGIWYHNCHIDCESEWHYPVPRKCTYILSSINNDSATATARDVHFQRLDLLPNSDGNFNTHPTGPGDVPATAEQVEKYLNSLEVAFDDDADLYIRSNPDDVLKSLPDGYALMYRARGTTEHRKGDLYLWGHPSGLWFSSAARFSKHLGWLAGARDKECECLPCNDKRG